MTLKEFKKVVAEAAEEAHLFATDSIGAAHRIRSVSLRLDDDGVLSVLLHKDRMRNRVETADSARLKDALGLVKQLVKEEPELKAKLDEFDGYYVHWNVIIECLNRAWPDGGAGYTSSPLELIAQLIDERDEALAVQDPADEPDKAAAEA